MPSITINNYTLEQVYTYKKSIAVEFNREFEHLHSNTSGNEKLVFIDKNNNKKLDINDVIVKERSESVFSGGKTRTSFSQSRTSVTNRHIAKYGKRVSTLFQQAQTERKRVKKNIPAKFKKAAPRRSKPTSFSVRLPVALRGYSGTGQSMAIYSIMVTFGKKTSPLTTREQAYGLTNNSLLADVVYSNGMFIYNHIDIAK